MSEPDFPNQGEQDCREDCDETERHEDARQFIADEVEFQRVTHRLAGPAGSLSGRNIRWQPLCVLKRLVT
jgi:hypothetical protein